MRYPIARLSPASPPNGQTPRRRSTAPKAKAGADGQPSATLTSVREAGLSAPASVNPLAPASAALEARGSVGDSPELNLRYLRPAPDERETWNRRLGRVDSRPDDKARYDTIYPLDDSHAERLITTQSPQRPQATPTFQIQVDGRTVPVFEGQTILEACRSNGIEVPTLCYEPKLPGFGACRMCVVEVEGEEHPPISCSRLAEPGMVVQTQTEKVRRLRRTNLELIFSDHNAYCLPPCQNKCPSHIDIPGFLRANAEGQFRESARIFKRTIPFPSILGRVCPAPCEEHCRRDEVDEAIAIRDSHRYAGDVVLREQKEGIAPPLPFEMEPKSGKRVAIVGSGPAGMSAAYYLLMSGHEVTVFEKDPEPGGMLRYGIPEYRLPKAEVLDPEYEAVWRLGGRLECNKALGKDFSLEDLERQGFDATIVAIGCYSTNKLGAENENADGVIDGLDYLRTATLGLPYPGHKGSRVVIIGGGFTAMDCSRTSVRQGAKEITLVYRRDMKDMPAYSEAHEAMEEGVKMIFEAGPTRVLVDDRGKVTGVEFIRMHPGEPDASGRRRPEPSPGSEFVVECDRVLLAIGQAPDLTWIGGPSDGIASNRGRLQADAVTFETGRPGVFGTGDVRIGSATVVQAIAEGRRCAYAVDAYVKGTDLSELRQRQTLAETQPTFLSIVPFTDEPKEARYRLKTVPAKERKKNYDEYEVPYTAAEVMAESTRCLQCTCEAVGFCDLRRLGIEYGTTLATLEPKRDQGAGFRSVTENRFTGTNHDYIRDDSHAFILREPSRCIDCGRCANVCAEVVGAACYDFMRSGFDTLVTTPLDMSLNDTPCVSCGRCAETCPTGALMPKPRVLTKYDVDESRCILCGICVDACPYDALRDGQDNELSHTSRANPQIDLLALADVDRETEVTYVQRERDWVARATAEGRLTPPTYDEYELPASLATPSRGGSGRGARKP
jgi:NADPH-dependent glutamate synthase beta subunit-like oxidoreductase/formate hydrogenlyase subunit 6/NADH:ubiquinone oxidoreductase subunit I/ferredoxin